MATHARMCVLLRVTSGLSSGHFNLMTHFA